MGLTLNSNSLTLESAGSGGGSSGLTQAQVDARIAAKQPWTFIEQIEITSPTTYADFTLSSDYSTFMVQGDDVIGTTTSYVWAQYKIANGAVGNGYGFNGYRGRSSSNAYYYSENDQRINFGTDSTDHAKTFEIVFTTTSNSRRPVFRFHYGGGTSTYDAAFVIGGGQLNISTSTEITGFRFAMNTGNISEGKYKLYGLNDHA